jgi:site-specific recombinase XerD
VVRRRSKVHTVRVVGPLEGFQVGVEAAMAGAGYTSSTVARSMYLVRHLSIWLEERELDASDLSAALVGEYLSSRRADGCTRGLSSRAFAPLLGYLRRVGAAPDAVVEVEPTALGAVLDRYRAYLVGERGLGDGALLYYLRYARLFLSGWVDEGGSRLCQLRAPDVTGFAISRYAQRGVPSLKLTTVLRSLLRFLFVEGTVPVDLTGAVPRLPQWRGAGLPKAVDAANVSALLASCRGRGVVDFRDRAILLLLVRLGLRAGEVARLRLDDIDWRNGEVLIQGKANRDERLPLPADVGAALVDYLRKARPSSAAREVFINVQAPRVPMSAAGVQVVVDLATRRAGLRGISAHRLRHTAATQMLRAGTPLADIAQVLRHRQVLTTTIYAKVDRVALRELAAPWPGVSA